MAISPQLSISWLRRDHPIVERYLRRPQPRRLQALIAACASVTVLLFGSLGLPVIYLMFSLLLLAQMTVSTVEKAHEAATWDLIRLTPFARRELLLSLWAASLWQLQRTWIMRIYQLLHAMVMIGVLVNSIVSNQFRPETALALVLVITLFIAVQPYAAMYFSGMTSLAIANRLRQRENAQGLALGLMLVYWLASVGSVLAFIYPYSNGLPGGRLNQLLLVPLLMPLILGWCALLLAKRSL
jgi:hypothetical protein